MNILKTSFRISLCLLGAMAITSTMPLFAEEVEKVDVKLQDITLKVPKTWKQQQVSSSMRLAQFAIPAEEGDKEITEVVVFAPMGGSAPEQVKRWVGQFQPQGREANITTGKSEQGEYVFSDITGTHSLSTGGPIRKVEGYRIVNVMLTTKKGNYFFKITGPKATVAKAIESFRASFGADASKEKKFGE